MSWLLILILVICLLIMLAGFVSILFPFLPSVPLIWLGIFLYAVASNFEIIDAGFLLIVSILSLITIFIDYIAGLWGVKQFSASLWGVLGAVIGGVIGSQIGLFFALVVGPIIGALIGEMLLGKDSVFIMRMRRYTIIGFVGGSLLKISVGLSMIGLFIWKLLQK